MHTTYTGAERHIIARATGHSPWPTRILSDEQVDELLAYEDKDWPVDMPLLGDFTD